MNFLDQLELTERSYLSSSEPEHHLLINNTQQISDIGLDEGLGEPQEEEVNQKKIIAKRKTSKNKSKPKVSEISLKENCKILFLINLSE